MSTKRYTTIDDRLAQVRVLGKDNPSFLNLFNRESGSERICHVDEKCVIFF